jgi:hypothetical protein
MLTTCTKCVKLGKVTGLEVLPASCRDLQRKILRVSCRSFQRGVRSALTPDRQQATIATVATAWRNQPDMSASSHGYQPLSGRDGPGGFPARIRLQA